MPVFGVRTALSVGCTLLVLTGCGTSTIAGSPAGESATTATPLGSQELAKMVLQPGDFPSGWTSTPAKPDTDSSATDDEVTRCIGLPNTDGDRMAKADSMKFNLGEFSVDSTASSYRSESAIETDLAVLRSPKASGCFTDALKNKLSGITPPGATLGSVSYTITPGSAGGPANVSATGSGSVTVSAGGKTVTLYQEIVFLTGPLIEASITLSNTDAPVPAAQKKQLTEAIAARIPKR